ncbi:type II toxin-antitoxin system VapB family antitoxin [Nostoc sp.]|uniref:type II toxin-antitoxin system VapB family antitoxin n=1 Tax=Nostoc sp. TaxID=1180 RepID=UPI002FF4D919
MTSQILDSTSKLIAKLQTLAPEQQQQVLDFVEFLAQKYAQPQQPPQKRVLGLNQDKIWISDDFNDPLPDEFWLGESQG